MITITLDRPLKTYQGMRNEGDTIRVHDHVGQDLIRRKLAHAALTGWVTNVGEAPRPAVKDEAPRPPVKDEAPRPQLTWDKKVPPAVYLDKWPNGPAAALARKILGKD